MSLRTSEASRVQLARSEGSGWPAFTGALVPHPNTRVEPHPKPPIRRKRARRRAFPTIPARARQPVALAVHAEIAKQLRQVMPDADAADLVATHTVAATREQLFPPALRAEVDRVFRKNYSANSKEEARGEPDLSKLAGLIKQVESYADGDPSSLELHRCRGELRAGPLREAVVERLKEQMAACFDGDLA